jgi:hypothetical protein
VNFLEPVVDDFRHARVGLSLALSTGMNTKPLEPMLRDATIKAIDGVAKKLSSVERSAESKVSKLLTYWNEMETTEKEQAVGIAIATVSTAVMAIGAFRGKSKTPLKKAAKKVARAVVKKVV